MNKISKYGGLKSSERIEGAFLSHLKDAKIREIKKKTRSPYFI